MIIIKKKNINKWKNFLILFNLYLIFFLNLSLTGLLSIKSLTILLLFIKVFLILSHQISKFE